MFVPIKHRVDNEAAIKFLAAQGLRPGTGQELLNMFMSRGWSPPWIYGSPYNGVIAAIGTWPAHVNRGLFYWHHGGGGWWLANTVFLAFPMEATTTQP